MSSNQFLSIANSTLRLTSFVAVAVLANSYPALAQSVNAASPGRITTQSLIGRQTPREVLDGIAKLLHHSDPQQMLRVVFGLQPPHPEEEKQFLEELGKKGSPNFQHFLTAEEWNRRFAPSQQDEQAVVDWAESQGLTVSHRYSNRLVVDVEGPVGNVEKAMGVRINNYQVGSRITYANDSEPVLPAHLTNIVHSVGGLNNIQQLRPATKGVKEPEFAAYSSGPVVAAGAAGAVSASAKPPSSAKARGPKPNISGGAYDPTDLYSSEAYDLNALYNQGHCCNPLNNAGVTPPESSIAIATAGTQDGNDFTGFHNAYPYLAWHYQMFYIDGTPTCCDGEGTMDFEWSTAMSNSFGSYVDTAMVYMYDGVNANFSTFTDIYNQILTDGKARVFSTSWGCEEIGCTPTATMDTDHAIFDSMIGQGWTLVAASGDQGATAGCGNALAVQYPASDPDVVGAGGTTLSLDSYSNFLNEVAWSGGPDGCGSNDGGSTGGVSSYYGSPSYQSSLGYSMRAVPDLALNADWYNTPQNFFFGGSLSGNGGTSIVAPEIAGVFAQVNAYLDYVGTINGGCYGGGACAPIGNGNWYLYYFGENPSYARHYPFYDVTTGCNNNDVTSYWGLGYYCASYGYDPVTGWGSFNALQLSWAINTYRANDGGAPATTFSGPLTNHWYNTDQSVSWTVADTGVLNPIVGVAGFSQAWDSDPGDVSSEATPGYGNSFYSGPQYPNATTGYENVSWIGQGCHTANVRSWDNAGNSANATYGPVCYDTVAPVTNAAFSGTISGGVYVSAVHITLTSTDSGSGVAGTYYSLDGGATATYSGPLTVSATGTHSILYYSRDVAGNVSSSHTTAFTIKSPTSTTLTASSNPSTYGLSVTFTAQVTASFGSPATGAVTFKDGATTLGTGTISSGKATLATSALAAGSHTITATYAGSGNDLTSTSASLSHTVNKANTTTTLMSSLNPSNYNRSVTFTATIVPAFGGTVSGTVTFKDGATTIGTGAVNAVTKQATFATLALLPGTHSITADYSGSTNLNVSNSSTFSEVVNKANTTTTVSSSLNPSNYHRSVTFTATIVPAFGGAVSGTVTFKDGTATLGTGTVNAVTKQATFATLALLPGTHAITAAYSGNADLNVSTSTTLSEVVNKANTATTLASSLNPSTHGQTVTFTATIAPAYGGSASGTVTFKDGATTLGAGTVNTTTNKAVFATSALAVGTHSITADYGGSTNLNASNSAALSQVVH